MPEVRHHLVTGVLPQAAFERAGMGAGRRIVFDLLNHQVAATGPSQHLLAQITGDLLGAVVPLHDPLVDIDCVHANIDPIH